MLHQENSSRELVWIEGQNVEGWGCSECSWVFNPSGPPAAGESLDEMKRTFRTQLSEEFASHACAEHPRVKGATPWRRRVG
jgi:rubredoxin